MTNTPPINDSTWIYSKQSLFTGELDLKGWRKTDINQQNNPTLNLDYVDVIDLNRWKYYQEVPILDHYAILNNKNVEEEAEAEAEDKDATERLVKKSTEDELLTLLGGLDG